jgi:hypothetical protein
MRLLSTICSVKWNIYKKVLSKDNKQLQSDNKRKKKDVVVINEERYTRCQTTQKEDDDGCSSIINITRDVTRHSTFSHNQPSAAESQSTSTSRCLKESNNNKVTHNTTTTTAFSRASDSDTSSDCCDNSLVSPSSSPITWRGVHKGDECSVCCEVLRICDNNNSGDEEEAETPSSRTIITLSHTTRLTHKPQEEAQQAQLSSQQHQPVIIRLQCCNQWIHIKCFRQWEEVNSIRGQEMLCPVCRSPQHVLKSRIKMPPTTTHPPFSNYIC